MKYHGTDGWLHTIVEWTRLDINHTSDNRWYDISKTNCLHLLYTTFQNSNKEMILFPLRAAVRGLVRELKNSDSPWQWESHVMPFQIFPVNWVAWMPWNSLGTMSSSWQSSNCTLIKLVSSLCNLCRALVFWEKQFTASTSHTTSNSCFSIKHKGSSPQKKSAQLIDFSSIHWWLQVEKLAAVKVMLAVTSLKSHKASSFDLTLQKKHRSVQFILL